MIVEKSRVAEMPSGWQAQLDLEFTKKINKTVLTHRQQRGPLTVQRAFYPEGDVCHLYVLHPPGGVVGGDILTINALVHDNAKVLLTTPGATKFYRSQGNTAIQQHNLYVGSKASLEWLPQENIYFPGAQVSIATQINLATNARFIGWETQCLGLPVNNKSFLTGQLQFDFSLNRNERPILIERMQVNADRLNSVTGLRGYPVMAMFIATPADEHMLETVRVVLAEYEHEISAATLVDECLIVRYLGTSTAKSRKIFTKLWTVLRPEIVERKACPPRIWAT